MVLLINSRLCKYFLIFPLDLPDNNPLKWRFYKTVIGKKPSQLNSYWSRALFTGSGVPPRVIATQAGLVHAVQSGSGLIGYIDADQVKPDMNIIYRQIE